MKRLRHGVPQSQDSQKNGCGVPSQAADNRRFPALTGLRPCRLMPQPLCWRHVKVSYRRGWGQGLQLVSPRERERFMQTLQRRVDGAAGHTAG